MTVIKKIEQAVSTQQGGSTVAAVQGGSLVFTSGVLGPSQLKRVVDEIKTAGDSAVQKVLLEAFAGFFTGGAFTYSSGLTLSSEFADFVAYSRELGVGAHANAGVGMNSTGETPSVGPASPAMAKALGLSPSVVVKSVQQPGVETQPAVQGGKLVFAAGFLGPSQLTRVLDEIKMAGGTTEQKKLLEAFSAGFEAGKYDYGGGLMISPAFGRFVTYAQELQVGPYDPAATAKVAAVTPERESTTEKVRKALTQRDPSGDAAISAKLTVRVQTGELGTETAATPEELLAKLNSGVWQFSDETLKRIFSKANMIPRKHPMWMSTGKLWPGYEWVRSHGPQCYALVARLAELDLPEARHTAMNVVKDYGKISTGPGLIKEKDLPTWLDSILRCIQAGYNDDGKRYTLADIPIIRADGKVIGLLDAPYIREVAGA